MVQNIPEYSVSELAGSVRRTLEGAFGLVRVRGEISGFKAYASGHGYFDLKDMDAVIAGVMWKGNLARLPFRPENGLEVIATGKVSAYPKSSKFQLIVEHMEVAGIGAILKQIEERRKKLQAEGLFDRAAKPKPPFIPRHIGVVTSPQGAVIRDILHRLADRFPRRVTLWPVSVQGDGAGDRIAAAINGFNALPADRRPDLLIVGRGGGSFEDLMPFNDEAVVRAAAASRIPLISAVGHETDTTLIDHASAIRAPTPTAAAELAVPVRAELVELLADLALRARRAERQGRGRQRERLDALAARLPRPANLAAIPRQRLDEAGERLPRALTQRLRYERERLTGLRLPRPAALLPPYQQRFQALADRAAPRLLRDLIARDRARLESPRHTPNPALLNARLSATRERLTATFRLVESLSPQAVMARGFVLVELPDGQIARQRQQAEAAGHFTLKFADGALSAIVAKPAGTPEKADKKPDSKAAKPAARSKAEPSSPRQGSLL